MVLQRANHVYLLVSDVPRVLGASEKIALKWLSVHLNNGMSPVKPQSSASPSILAGMIAWLPIAVLIPASGVYMYSFDNSTHDP